MGFKDDFELIEKVADSYDAVVHQANDRLMLVKQFENDANLFVIVEFQKDRGWHLWFGKNEGAYYGVTTGFPDVSKAWRLKHKRKGSLHREIHKKGGKLLKGREIDKNEAP